MGRMTIKKKGKKKIKVPYDQELNEMKEWQDHQYVPGYYIDKGRLPYPLRRLSSRPRLKKLYLLFILCPLFVGAIFNAILNGVSLQELLIGSLMIGTIAWIIYDSKRYVKR